MKMIYRCFCLFLGALLGTGCDDRDDPVEYGPGPMPEYGVPTGHVIISGQVNDGLGDPIEGIEVSFVNAAPTTTDASGNFSINQENVYVPCAESSGSSCSIEARDVDGEDNGGDHVTVEMELDLDQTDPGAGSYDQGTWEKHDVEVSMHQLQPHDKKKP